MRRIVLRDDMGRLSAVTLAAPADAEQRRIDELLAGSALTFVADDPTGAVDIARDWFDGATIAPRPEHADLPTNTVAAGAPLGGFLAGWPARLLLDGAVQAEGEIPASGALTFGDPGLWVVELVEAWALGPHCPRAYSISVTP